MLVKLKTPLFGLIHGKAGDVVEVEEGLAQSLLSAHYAELVNDVKNEEKPKATRKRGANKGAV